LATIAIPVVAPAPPPPNPSIHDRPLSTGGGIWARSGFAFQDHATVGFCLEMLSDDSKLKSVWCEGPDDITLIWEGTAGDEVEFVQVKTDDHKSFWSTSILCKRDAKVKKENQVGTSILEKSLACDCRFLEPRRFRMVTSLPVNEELKILSYPLGSEARDKKSEKMMALAKDIVGRVPEFKSERGNDCNFWLEHALWDVRHCEESLRTENLRLMTRWAEKNGIWLLQDQIESLYSRLLARVQEAAKFDPRIDPLPKKLLREGLFAWLAEEARKIEQPTTTPAGERLRKKLQAAKITDSDIDEAAELRRHFRQEQISPQYVGKDDQQRIVREIGARLLVLRTRLDSGLLVDDGVNFHAICVEEIQSIPTTLGLTNTVDVSFLLGCMYNITDRCPHRFRRATS